MNRDKLEELALLAVATFFVAAVMFFSLAGLLGVEW